MSSRQVLAIFFVLFNFLASLHLRFYLACLRSSSASELSDDQTVRALAWCHPKSQTLYPAAMRTRLNLIFGYDLH